MAKYSVVFTDLDGTILKNDKTISERTSKALRDLRDKEILWVVATARPEVAIDFYDEIHFADALITLNGAKIRLHDKIINNGFAKEDALKILEAIKDKDLIVTLETSEGIFGNTEIPEWETHDDGDLIKLAEKVDVYKILIAGKDHQLPTIKEDREKFCGIKELEEIINEAISSTGTTDSVYYSVAEGWLYQIMSRNATKWKGVDLVLKTEGIDPSNAVYFGDDNDDIDSIKNCGLGVAMGNAIDKVKVVADVIAPANEEDGVASVIEQLKGQEDG